MATGFRLMDAFRSKVNKIKLPGVNAEAEFDVAYPTGFLSLDFLNGQVIHVETEKMNTSYRSIGILDGSANTFIGRSGCGKSTFIMQVAANIVRPYDRYKSLVFIDDIEGSLPQYRKEILLGFDREEFADRVNMRNKGITTENVYRRIKEIHDLKMDNRDEFEYDTGLYDTDGNRIFKLYPTVYVIDSLPLLMPEDVSEKDEMEGSMGASAIAKANTQLVKKICQLIKESNIILFTINHILDDISINPYQQKQASVSGLKQGERLPGGKAAIYLANNMFRLDDTKQLKATEGFGIDGSVVYASIIKSRSNVTRRSVPLIFNKTEGCFDNTLSLFYFLKEEGRIGGAGVGLYMPSLPSVKFAQKNFKQKLEENPELQKAFSEECLNALSELLSDKKVERFEEGETPKFDINSAILSI